MFNTGKKQSHVLEAFRIRAHLRSYVRDPVIVAPGLMRQAVEKLKKLPYENRDPAARIAIEVLLDGYRQGHFHFDDLTAEGRQLVRDRKYRRHHGLSDRVQPAQVPKSHYQQFS